MGGLQKTSVRSDIVAQAATGDVARDVPQKASRGMDRSAPQAAAPAQQAAPQGPLLHVTPVGGLSQAQMDNAAIIVAVGGKMYLPAEAKIAAVMCSLQETRLLNLASGVLPDSLALPNQGVGWDHDSVGLFQQRPNWGTVPELLNPEYAATAFYKVLVTIPNWWAMPLTYAIQSVQVSAFPEAYAKHEALARQIVTALRA
ncbi:hypothetical protein [Longispora fulva]|uniref:Uncharacterized protein n=1 Tax=Longispora fulva TaxID=619741 RepID=A0A8J7GF29_9ACTN|nr:hypothetical protein [Longispora fulva]MBG6135367.1 hypothetical protein [Longispora fulva]